MTQDKDGFIWFATDAGLSRFDGTHFRNFNLADGLPEVEILRVHADSRGRVWVLPFRNSICYYYKGKIYTQQDDPQLRKVKLTTVPLSIYESEGGDIGFFSHHELLVIRKDTVQNTGVEYFRWPGLIVTAGFHGDITFVYSNDSLFDIRNGQVIFRAAIPRRKGDSVALLDMFTKNYSTYIKAPGGGAGSGLISDSYVKYHFINTRSGTWLLDTISRRKFSEVFLPNKRVNTASVDFEGSFWFGTPLEGVYKLTSRHIQTWKQQGDNASEIFAVEKNQGQVLAGSGAGVLYQLSGKQMKPLNFTRYLVNLKNISQSTRLVCMLNTPGAVLLGYDGFLLSYDLQTQQLRSGNVDLLKSMTHLDGDIVLVATGRRALLVNSKLLTVIDTLYPYRSTAIQYHDNEFYIGTVEGVKVITKNKQPVPLVDTLSALRSRISCFAKSPDGSLWIGTYGRGLIRMKEHRVTAYFTTQSGLSSNICRSLFYHKGFMWVGSEQGISKINIDDPHKPIAHYSTADGLPSDKINTIYVDNDTVYVGSPAGLTIFNESRISAHSRCELKLLDLTVEGQQRSPDSIGHLSYRENSLKFAYVGISYKSGGDILYRYRLRGMRDNWDSTRQTVLDFPALPPGDYELELQAINKFGVSSALLKLPFSIATPFWKSTWFQLLVVGIAISLTWLLIYTRFRTIRKRDQEKVALQSRMNDLEQQALRSQMNPHFIFNCLNSIQNFIVHNDFETTNQYLTEFSYLIRQTLDNSTKSTIALDNEIIYLTRYLEMEKMRFSNCFNYRFETDSNINTEQVFIPAMLLQPYVENSIRHGVRYIKGGQGLITIKFQRKEQTLVCIIQDNGIGRKKAGEFKSLLHLEYQSKGMTLTAERIRALNRQQEEQITIEVDDLNDQEDLAAGTKITIHFPNTIIT